MIDNGLLPRLPQLQSLLVLRPGRDEAAEKRNPAGGFGLMPAGLSGDDDGESSYCRMSAT
jgi:hypothetical protein